MSEDVPKLDITTFLLSSIHDMKNSLGVMTAFMTDALSSLPEQDSPAREKTTQALYEAQRVSDHLIQLLALHKIEQAFYPFDPQDHLLSELAQDALNQVAQLAQSKGIGLESRCEANLYGWFDYELICGVVVQALHNALRYGKGRVLLTLQPRDKGIAIRVEDDGPGYPPALLQLDSAMDRAVHFAQGSTGLGLYFAKVVARLHGVGGRSGEVRLENGGCLGGSCFILELP